MDPSRYIYADNAATTPLSPAALDAMMPYLTTDFGNPGGIHRVAKQAASDLNALRNKFAELIGADSPRHVLFTSGGSESDTWAITSAVEHWLHKHPADAPARIITTPIEHHAVLRSCEYLQDAGRAKVILLPVDEYGFVDPHNLDKLLGSLHQQDLEKGADAPPAALVSVMLANNEVGTIEPVRELASIAHAHGVPLHTDAVQAVGHIPVSLTELGADALSLSGHKFHGPRGTGALIVSESFPLRSLIQGGEQEQGLRAGTENLAGIAGMTAALAEASASLSSTMKRVATQRDTLVHALLKTVANIKLTGAPLGDRRLPSIASFVIKDIDAELLCVLLDKAGIAAATGSACNTGSTEPSHVVTALGFTDSAWSSGTLRLSLADNITPEDIQLLIERVPPAIKRARLLSSHSL